MKRAKTLTAFILLMLGSFLIVHPALAQNKFAYVNTQRILSNYQEALDVQKQLDTKNQEWQKELQDMQADIRQKQERLDKQGLMLSERKKTELQQEIEDSFTQYQKFQQDKWGQNGEAFKLQDELLAPIREKVLAVVQRIGKDEEYDFIFDEVIGNILYASDKHPDLTDKVLEELNKGLSQ